MKHPEMLLLPVLMLCDYYLTLVGCLLYRKGYRNSVRIEQYELNPMWQSSVANMRWLNPRHLIGVALVTGLVFVPVECLDWPPEVVAFLLGVLVMGSAVLVSGHIANILLFRYALRHPTELSGQVHIGYEMSLKTVQYRLLPVLLPLLLVAVLAPSPFLIGGTISVLMLMLAPSRWLRKHRKRKAKEKAAASAEESPKPDGSGP